jgi:hypothetical protein
MLPAGWPVGKPLAIAVSVMLEGWSDDAAPGVGPMGNVLPAGALDLQARSWAEYGVTTGAWRILDILAKARVRAVFYTSGVVAARAPALLRAIADAGHVVAAHGWSQHIIPATQTEAAEAADLARCIAALTQAAGVAPRGWLSPRCTPSGRTTGLLAGNGFTWHADFFDSDLPRVVATAAGPIVAMPFSMDVNDMPLSVRYGQPAEAFTRTLETIVAGWPALGGRPGCVDVTVHAHVYGRPAGALAFIDALEVVKRYADWAWLTDHAALAGLWQGDRGAATV